MEYAALVDIYERLEATQADHELRDIVAEVLAAADDEHLPIVVTLLRGDPFAAWQPDELGLSSNLTLEAIARATGVDENEIEDRWRETGDLGSAAEWAVANAPQQTLVTDELRLVEVYEKLREIAEYEGKGSQGRRINAVAGLLADADPVAAKYIVRTVLGHLRLGIGEGTIRDGIAAAFLNSTDEDAVSAVERAFQVTNDYRVVAEVARDEGHAGLEALEVELGRPLGVMLARKAEDLVDAFDTVAPEGEALLEYKLDGFRIQIHIDGNDVTVFTRRLEDVTAQFPEVVEWVRKSVNAETAILEGEVIAEDPDTGEPLPFQELSRRIKRKYDVAELRETVPVSVHLFDLLYLDEADYLEESLDVRLEALDSILEPLGGSFDRVAHRRTDSLSAAESFYESALESGHEGIMAKNLDAAYQPGRRVGYAVKVKPTMEPLDLTVVRAKWSEGRRRNRLGRLFLGCRDTESGDWSECGRLSTGFSDEELAEITERLEPTIQSQDGREVHFDPSIVIQVAYEEIQESPEYDSGYALRFPRFEGFRDDLDLQDVDTIERLEHLFQHQ
ncbi:MAG: ATP-dependent DNA ligase [Salinirussus sp.]